MRIAYLLESTAISGGSKVAFQQARGLALRGNEVTIVSPDPPPDWFDIVPARFEQSLFDRSAALARTEIAVATFWTTVEPAIRHAGGTVFHLCQGYEADFAFYAGKRSKIETAYAMPARKLVVAPWLADRLQKAGWGEAICVGQTFEPEEFRVDGRRFDRTPPRILLPGMFDGEIKGIAEALDALSALRARGAEFVLVRLSTEPVSASERTRGVCDEYHREIPPPLVPRLLASADLFLGPSRPEEGFDLPALEALASGLPCALSDTPAHRNSAGENAVFFRPVDVVEIGRALELLLDDAALRARLSAEGPRRASLFQTGFVVDRLQKVFAEAVAGE